MNYLTGTPPKRDAVQRFIHGFFMPFRWIVGTVLFIFCFFGKMIWELLTVRDTK